MVLLALVVAGTTACEGSDENGNQGGSAAGDGEGADDGFTGSGGFGMGLQIDPPEATIIVDNGVSSPVQLKAYRNGEEVDPDSWMVDFGTIADVDTYRTPPERSRR